MVEVMADLLALVLVLETIGTVLLRLILGNRAILVLLVGTTGNPIQTPGKIPSPRIKTTKITKTTKRPQVISLYFLIALFIHAKLTSSSA